MDCPSCGHANPESAKFCNECARALAPRDPATSEGERRQLTVMFCDLVGSTELASQMDAEDFRELVGQFQEVAAEAIDCYGGHIAQYLGDGVLVYFGYPRAHENDAERATRAGLGTLSGLAALNETLEPRHGVRLSARVGVHTGPVVVGEIGAGPRRETLALGDTINIAARLQEASEPGSVSISDATMRLVLGLFRAEPLGALRLKGLVEPVFAHAVLQLSGVQSRLDVDPSRLTPLVGRESEIGTLLDRWQRTEDGEGQAILVSGEAGVGKSRLLRVLRDRLSDQPHRWLECHSSPFTQGTAFSTVTDLVRRGLGLQPDDAAEDQLLRVERAVEEAGLDVVETAPLLALLLALPVPPRYPRPKLAPELLRKRTIEALVAWTFSLADERPLVVAVEDLHWCDPSTLAFLEMLLEQAATAPIAVVLTFRSEFQPPWPLRSQFTHIALPRLRPRQAQRLIRAVADERELPGPVVNQIVERADGVPLFLEELTKSVVESPTGVGAIPLTLKDSLMARLDHLPNAREVAQAGAVLGRRFSYRLLEATSSMPKSALLRGLDNLIAAELVVQRGTAPDAHLIFKHALIQDIAYESLLRRQRSALHARAADALEAQSPELIDSEPEVVARHCDYAGLNERAISHYRRAGLRAIKQSAAKEAIGHLARAIELLAELPETNARNQMELELQSLAFLQYALVDGWRDGSLGRRAERLEELLTLLPKAPVLVRFNVWMTLYAYHVIPGGPGLDSSTREALKTAEEARDTAALTAGHNVRGDVLYFQGRFSDALVHLDQAIDLYDFEKHGPLAFKTGMDQGITARMYRASCLWAQGYPERATREAELALDLAKQLGHPFSLAHMNAHAFIEFWRYGNPESARHCAEESVRVCEEFGLSLYLRWAMCNRAVSRQSERSLGETAAELSFQIARMVDFGTQTRVQTMFVFLADLLRRIGRVEEGLLAIEQGFDLAGRSETCFEDAELYRVRGELLLANATDSAPGVSSLERALETARDQQARALELRAATSLARLWQSQGKAAEARGLLAPVYDWFTEGFDTQDLKDAKALLGELG